MSTRRCLFVSRLGSRFSRPIPLFVLSLAALLAAGCGSGGGSGSGTTATGNTTVVLLASGTANDQLSSFTVNLKSLTLTTQSGATVNVLASPVSEEFIHLNSRVEPLATVSLPQGEYVSASAAFDGANPVCNGQGSGAMSTDGLAGGPSGTISVPQPITVTGEAMGLVLNLQVNEYPEACPTTSAEFVSAPPVTASFSLVPLTIAAQPTNSSNGVAAGLQGIVASLDSGGGGMSVTALVSFQTPPVWQVSFNSSTVFQGVSSASQMASGLPVNLDVAIQPDGTLLATRVEVLSTDTTNLTLSNGSLIQVDYASTVTFVTGTGQQGYLSPPGNGGLGYVNFANAQFQISGQFADVTALPFSASFDSANVVPGQNVTVTTQATATAGGPAYTPLTTMTLTPQTVNGTVTGISTAGGFTTYTVTLAAYDLFPQFAVQPGQTTLLTNPSTVVVYADSSTQMLNSSSVSVGGVFRFYGLVFNNNGALTMDCAQVTDGVAE